MCWHAQTHPHPGWSFHNKTALLSPGRQVRGLDFAMFRRLNITIMNKFMKNLMTRLIRAQLNVTRQSVFLKKFVTVALPLLHWKKKTERLVVNAQHCSKTSGRLSSALSSHQAFPWRGSLTPWNPAECILFIGELCSPLGFLFFFIKCSLTEQKYQTQVR